MEMSSYKNTSSELSSEGKRHVSLNILLIEDSESDAYVTKRALRGLAGGVGRVHHAECMEDAARALAEGFEPDIILLDLGLPDTICEKDSFARISSVKGEIPVIILTSVIDHEMAVSFVDNGASDYVKKSVIGSDPEALCDAIAFTLSRQKNLQEIEERKNKELEDKDQYINWISGGYSGS